MWSASFKGVEEMELKKRLQKKQSRTKMKNSVQLVEIRVRVDSYAERM